MGLVSAGPTRTTGEVFLDVVERIATGSGSQTGLTNVRGAGGTVWPNNVSFFPGSLPDGAGATVQEPTAGGRVIQIASAVGSRVGNSQAGATALQQSGAIWPVWTVPGVISQAFAYRLTAEMPVRLVSVVAAQNLVRFGLSNNDIFNTDTAAYMEHVAGSGWRAGYRLVNAGAVANSPFQPAAVGSWHRVGIRHTVAGSAVMMEFLFDGSPILLAVNPAFVWPPPFELLLMRAMRNDGAGTTVQFGPCRIRGETI